MEKENDPPRFGRSSEEDVERVLAAKTPKSTTSATTFWVKVFAEYIASGPNAGMDLKTADKKDIAKVLSLFYLDVRKKDQTLYKRNSYLAARSAIHRHLMSIRDDIDLFSSPEFKQCNSVLDGVLKEKKKQGEEPAVQHKDSISDADWKFIEEYFKDIQETLDPRKLCTYVWFHLTSKFGLRGREVQTNMKKADIELRIVEGKEVFSLSTDFLSKNHQGGVCGSSHVSAGLIQDPLQVEAIKRYLSKLHPDVDRLFQRAGVGAGCCVSPAADVWYMKAPLGHTILGNMMRNLSEAAKLSTMYTNHCVRATTVTHLKEAGVEDRTICEVSGHKNPASLAAYDRVTPQKALRLSAAIDQKAAFSCASSTSSLSATSSSTVPFVFNAAGASFANSTITVNVGSPAPKRKNVSLQLRKTTERLQNSAENFE